MQDYWFSKPLPADESARLLAVESPRRMPEDCRAVDLGKR